MGKTFDIYDIGLVLDVTARYDAYRQEAKTGIDALLLEAYQKELSDHDDRCFVFIALALSHLKHKGKVSTSVQKETLSILKSKEFIQRFQETEDESFFQSFCEWKADFEKKVENGVAIVKRSPKKRKKLPKMQVGDLFRLYLDEKTQKQYGTILLLVIDYCEIPTPNTPIYYLLVTRNPIDRIEDFSTETTFFIPVSKRFEQYDFRRLLLNNSMETYLTLTHIGNIPDYPKPMQEFIPEKKEFYSWDYLENMTVQIETGLNLLRKTYRQ